MNEKLIFKVNLQHNCKVKNNKAFTYSLFWGEVVGGCVSLSPFSPMMSLHPCVFVPLLAQKPAVHKTSIEERFPQSLGLKRRRVARCVSLVCFPPPLLPVGSSGLPKSTPPAHSLNQLRAVTLKSPTTCRHMAVTSLKPGSCVSSRLRRNQVSVTFHAQTPPPTMTGQAITGPGSGPCVPPCCPTAGKS